MGLKECIIILKDMNYDSRVNFINSIKADVKNNAIINIWESAHRKIKKYEINALKTIVENPIYIRSLSKEMLNDLRCQISNYILRLSAENVNKDLPLVLPEIQENKTCISELHETLNVINQEINDREVVVDIIKDDLGLKRH